MSLDLVVNNNVTEGLWALQLWKHVMWWKRLPLLQLKHGFLSANTYFLKRLVPILTVHVFGTTSKLSRCAASAAAPYPLGFIHLDLDGWILDVEREAPKPGEFTIHLFIYFRELLKPPRSWFAVTWFGILRAMSK